jgi:hypothetical protein
MVEKQFLETRICLSLQDIPGAILKATAGIGAHAAVVTAGSVPPYQQVSSFNHRAKASERSKISY